MTAPDPGHQWEQPVPAVEIWIDQTDNGASILVATTRRDGTTNLGAFWQPDHLDDQADEQP